MQLNAIFRLKEYMSEKELEFVLNSFIYSNFNYCLLVWHFSTNKSIEKLTTYISVVLDQLSMIIKVTTKLF